MSFSTKAEVYINTRAHFRKKHTDELFTKKPEANLLVATINELVASLTLFYSKKDISKIPDGQYCVDLILSYCRSHFIISDLLLWGYLIESATLIRKQMELLSRLNEIKNGVELDRIIKKTPNIKNLKSRLKQLYGIYSEISHSASPPIMELLGQKDIDGKVYTVLYPEFQENCFVALQHQALCCFEFYIWCRSFILDHFVEYDETYDSLLLQQAITQYDKITLDKFTKT